MRLIIGVFAAAALLLGSLFVWRESLDQDARKKALELAKHGRFWDAEPTFKSSLARRPDDVEVLRSLAIGYLRHQRNGEAEECLTQWLALAPRTPEALLARLHLYRELGQFDKALLDVDRLLEIDAHNLAWGRKRVTVLHAAGRFTEADQECRRWLEAHPGDPGLRRSLAEIKRAAGDLAEAGVLLDAILSEAPGDTGVLMSRAQLHLNQDEPGKAVPLLRNIVEHDQNRQRAGRYYLALALNRSGQPEEGARVMEELRRMQEALMLNEDSEGQPDNLPLQLRTARAHFENNDLPRTIKVIRHIFDRDANHGAAHALLADVLDKQGQFDQAAEHRRRAGEKP